MEIGICLFVVRKTTNNILIDNKKGEELSFFIYMPDHKAS